MIVRKNAVGEKLGSVRVANDPLALAGAIADAGPEPEVVIEATYGWYWIVDWLQEQGATVHLANPSGLNWGTRRVKNDERDAIDLIDMLRLGRLRVSCASWCAIEPSWSRCGLGSKRRCMRSSRKRECYRRPVISSVGAATRSWTRLSSVTRTRCGCDHCVT